MKDYSFRLTTGDFRPLTDAEKKALKPLTATRYKYVVERPFTFEALADVPSSDGSDSDDYVSHTVTVPRGFLSDGASSAPDLGCSWLYHDRLYATHAWDTVAPGHDEACSRKEADHVMDMILRNNDRMSAYSWAFSLLARWNIFWLFSKAWKTSGARGPELLHELLGEDSVGSDSAAMGSAIEDDGAEDDSTSSSGAGVADDTTE